MRQVTMTIAIAFRNRRTAKIGSTRTDGDAIYLWDNKIAERRDDGLWITNAGWFSPTTKERLNGLTNVSIVQKKGVWYLNGHEWGGEWVHVDSFGAEPEREFDMTSTWVAEGGYDRPNYAVWHSNDLGTLVPIEISLAAMGVPFRRSESDTQGEYRPNYFVVVHPEDFNRVLTTITNN
jgi:hypothetical protein